jgi:hypothetical protein
MSAVRIERDPAFWAQVLAHPEVARGAAFDQAIDIAAVVGNPAVLPLRAEHGGFLICALDAAGWVRELHSLFTPEGWGREVHAAAKAALSLCFDDGMQALATYEARSNPRSRPPRSFGFSSMGEFTPAGRLGPRFAAVEMRGWILTRRTWEASPAFRSRNSKRMTEPCL